MLSIQQWHYYSISRPYALLLWTRPSILRHIRCNPHSKTGCARHETYDARQRFTLSLGADLQVSLTPLLVLAVAPTI